MSIIGDVIAGRGGSWSLRSKSDPRWNYDGEGRVSIAYVEGLEKKLQELRKKLGKQPKDLTISVMKD